MRPVDRGDDPRNGGQWEPYTVARDPLASRIGWACSFCEAPTKLGVHVEHKLPKVHHPAEESSWTNFLLACVHCNSRKGARAGFGLTDALWPDEDNTFRVFSYLGGMVGVKADSPRRFGRWRRRRSTWWA